MSDTNKYWQESGICDLPVGIRGPVLSLATYHKDSRYAVTKLQSFLGVKTDGSAGEITCQTAQNVLQLKSTAQETINELCDNLLEGEVNGARYCVGQFKQTSNGVIDPRQHKQKVMSFHKDNYGQTYELENEGVK
jgi:hypothetical protein